MEDVIGSGWAAEPASGGAGHQRRQPVARRPEAAAPASGSAATAAAGGAAKFKLGDQVLCSGRDKGIVEDVSCTQGHWVYTVKGARQDQADKKKKKTMWGCMESDMELVEGVGTPPRQPRECDMPASPAPGAASPPPGAASPAPGASRTTEVATPEDQSKYATGKSAGRAAYGREMKRSGNVEKARTKCTLRLAQWRAEHPTRRVTSKRSPQQKNKDAFYKEKLKEVALAHPELKRDERLAQVASLWAQEQGGDPERQEAPEGVRANAPASGSARGKGPGRGRGQGGTTRGVRIAHAKAEAKARKAPPPAQAKPTAAKGKARKPVADSVDSMDAKTLPWGGTPLAGEAEGAIEAAAAETDAEAAAAAAAETRCGGSAAEAPGAGGAAPVDGDVVQGLF